MITCYIFADFEVNIYLYDHPLTILQVILKTLLLAMVLVAQMF